MIFYGINQQREIHSGTGGRAVTEIIYQTACYYFSLELLGLENVVYRSQPQAIGVNYIGIPDTYTNESVLFGFFH